MKCFNLFFFVILTLITTSGCRVFDWFSKDSSSSSGSTSYTPPPVPETLEQERPEVKVRLGELTQALESKNIEKAVELCGGQEKYRIMFESNKDKMPSLSKLLASSTLTLISAGYGSDGVRMGEVSVNIASKTFSINVVKINGKWYFQDF
ncbi:MAG: hypothetical protein AB1403_05475 [Candidatus Riflebacteria bacterium]